MLTGVVIDRLLPEPLIISALKVLEYLERIESEGTSVFTCKTLEVESARKAIETFLFDRLEIPRGDTGIISDALEAYPLPLA